MRGEYLVVCVEVPIYDMSRNDIWIDPVSKGYNMHVHLFTRKTTMNLYKQVEAVWWAVGTHIFYLGAHISLGEYWELEKIDGQKSANACRKYRHGVEVEVKDVKIVLKECGVQYLVACVDVPKYDAIRNWELTCWFEVRVFITSTNK